MDWCWMITSVGRLIPYRFENIAYLYYLVEVFAHLT